MQLRSNAKNQSPHAPIVTEIPSKQRKRPADDTPPESPQKSKKLKLQASYTTQSPFPDYPHPTHAEALEVHDILVAAHQPNAPVVRRPPQTSSNSAQSCGQVPNVIEAIIGTILSQNTSGANCARAKKNLDDAFGRNNFGGIVNAPKEKVVDAIRTGGLANKKAGMIQGLLKAIKKKHGIYSLQHLAGEPLHPNDTPVVMKDEEIMAELLTYDGVGPKTASCVLLFCLERDSFAVDTHVYRLSRLLGWVPGKADRVLAQAHLDLRVPAHLKYGLHVLMVQHGRACKGCKNAGSGEGCVLRTYLKEKKIKTEEDFDQRLAEVNHEVEVKREDTG
ncbi:DNA glycosylase [Macrolepiota fuliginosa MF-IS2]|uniref:DNA glycosylase n=1 Tax=Macrolepiota fuliginosa MF-IS2 TaxID=1400762 RepID=A0A9P5XDL1_9AGAR|nr:DNA glycosylase [Macrolepiota fuliginosa MF-IS2]